MIKKNTSEIIRLLDSIKQLTGVNVLWKSGIGTKGDPALPEKYFLHCNTFCRKIKKNLIKKCSFNDSILVMKQCEKKRIPFMNKCHAGAFELIVPIIQNSSLEGALFLGPFKKSEKSCIHHYALKEYKKLAPCDSGIINPLREILATLAVFIIENMERLRLEKTLRKLNNKKLQAALGFIEKNFMKPISISDLTAVSNLSESRFIHLFKEEFGICFSEFLKNYRIDKAKKLLSETKISIYDAAKQCGYSNQCYFGLVFRRETGISPLHYRRVHMNKTIV